MGLAVSPVARGVVIGGVAVAALVGAFAIGSSRGSAAPSAAASGGQGAGATKSAVLAAASSSGRISVTGTGDVSGIPDQLVLNMGVQVSGGTVADALSDANAAVTRVTKALESGGVAAADIQTSGLSIWPNYPNDSRVPSSYAVSESLTATLKGLAKAGGEIDAAVRAGGNATTVNGISLNLSDTSSLLARARERAIADARAKAAQYAKALGEPLGAMISVTDQATTPPIAYSAQKSAMASGAVPISPGTQQLSVSVTVVFAA